MGGCDPILVIWRSRKAKRAGAREEMGEEEKGMWTAGRKAGKQADRNEDEEPGAGRHQGE